MSESGELLRVDTVDDGDYGMQPGTRVIGVRECKITGTRLGLPVKWLRGEPEMLSPNHRYHPTYVVDAENWEWLCDQFDNQTPPEPYTRSQIALWNQMVLERRS